MNVLFLDIDGVVNCKTTQQRYGPFVGIDPQKVAIVNNIVNETGCVIVLSSSWRLPPADMLQHVREHFNIHDITPDKRGLTDRGCEVIAWLKEHPEVELHAILDDNSDFHEDQPLFLTSWETGITQELADQVIRHLKQASANKKVAA